MGKRLCNEIFAREPILIVTLYNHVCTVVLQLVSLYLVKHTIILTEVYWIVCADIANNNLIDVQIFGLRGINTLCAGWLCYLE
jgi:hypothetical protein